MYESLSITGIKELLDEYVTIGLGLSEKDKVEYYLIVRYLDKCSQRLRARKNALRKQAETKYEQVMKKMINTPSFISNIPRDSGDEFWGSLVEIGELK